MSSLTGAEKEILEFVFDMKSGYFLEFSNADFGRFFQSYGVDIYFGAGYQSHGDSKANRMRAFWELEEDELVARVLFDLLDFCEAKSSPEFLERHAMALLKARAIAARLTGITREEIAGAQGPPTIEGPIVLNQAWYIGDQVEEGGFGRIHYARSESGETAVAKFIPKEPGAARELSFDELRGVPNVVPILDKGDLENELVLVMPRAEKSLCHHLLENGSLPLEEAVQVLSDVAQALAAMEGRVVHRDIKPQNILLLGGRWCLADFGISRYAEATTAPDTRKFYMSYPYAAPEQWLEERATSATDVYAIGVVAYELLTGALPFAGPRSHDYRHQHLSVTPDSISSVPLKLRTLIDECLFKAPQARPSPQDVLARLSAGRREASGAAKRLQQAHAVAVQRRAEVDREASVAKAEAERRSGLSAAAAQSLAYVVDLLSARIQENAPESATNARALDWAWTLNEATLSVSRLRTVGQPSPDDTHRLTFEIIAFSEITIKVAQDYAGYRGRSHSLWYCDAQEEGRFRWFETAFMVHPLISRRSRQFAPFALEPGRAAFSALSRVMDEYEVAWPFTGIDLGDEENFLERWMGWFADGAQGLLQRPQSMPEPKTRGTWRRGA